MPQTYKESTRAVQLRDPVVTRQPGQVVARPVDTYAAPSSAAADNLLQSLQAVSPGLQKYLDQKDTEQRDADADAAVVAHTKGEKPPENASTAFMNSYQKLDGYARAQDDVAAFKLAYQHDYDKDNGNFDEWSKKWWQERTKGLQEQPFFLRGYANPAAKGLAEVRGAHFQDQAGAVLERQNQNALSYLDGRVRELTSNGGVITPQHLAALRTGLQKDYNVSNKEFNGLVFESMKRLGDGGNFSIYQSLKAAHADGTPGMYYIPEWKQKIDAAEIHALNVYNEQHNKAAEQLEKDRKQRVQTTMYPLVKQALSGDYQGALVGLSALSQDARSPLNATELYEWQGHIEAMRIEPKETPAQADNATNLMVEIARGDKMSDSYIANMGERGEISWSKMMQSLDALHGRDQRMQSKSEHDQDAFKKVLEHPQIKNGEEALTDWFTVQTFSGSGDTTESARIRNFLGTAKAQYWQMIQDGKITPATALVEARKIIEQYKPMFEGVKATTVDPMKSPTYLDIGAQISTEKNAAGQRTTPRAEALRALQKSSLSAAEKLRQFNLIINPPQTGK